MSGRSNTKNARASSERTQVMIEPIDEDVTRQVLERLKEVGATRVNEIAEGFISAEIPVEEIAGLRELAPLGVLSKKQLKG